MKNVLSFILFFVLAIPVQAQSVFDSRCADVNGDGVVDVADIALVVSAMASASGTQSGTATNAADVNGDGIVDVADIATVISVMAAGGGSKASASVVAVDLGLPSGTLWANMNVGAEAPEDYGLYFAWAETVGYPSDPEVGRVFEYGTYKWMNEGKDSWDQINKYQLNDSLIDGCWYDEDLNFIGDGKGEIELEDDAAHVTWGGDWVMPTVKQIRELVKYTTSEWVSQNNVSGRLFTSKKNGSTLFFPAAGYRTGSYLLGDGLGGVYWTSTVLNTRRVRTLAFYSDEALVKHNARYNAFPVRAVVNKKED